MFAANHKVKFVVERKKEGERQIADLFNCCFFVVVDVVADGGRQTKAAAVAAAASSGAVESGFDNPCFDSGKLLNIYLFIFSLQQVAGSNFLSFLHFRWWEKKKKKSIVVH